MFYRGWTGTVVRRYVRVSWAVTSVVQDRVSAVKDNSVRAAIENDLDRGVPALISTTKLCPNVGKECKVKNAWGKKRLSNSVALAVKWKCRESLCDGLGWKYKMGVKTRR